MNTQIPKARDNQKQDQDAARQQHIDAYRTVHAHARRSNPWLVGNHKQIIEATIEKREDLEDGKYVFEAASRDKGIRSDGYGRGKERQTLPKPP